MSTNTDVDTYILARDAALRTRLHPDYISRLARESKIQSRRVGRKWYVDSVSLDAFLAAQNAEKEAWRKELKQKRRTEYRAKRKVPEASVIEEKLVEHAPRHVRHAVHNTVRYSSLVTPGVGSHMASYVIHPGVDFLHKAIAMFFSILIVFGTYGVFNREFGSAVTGSIAHSTSNVASAALVIVMGEIPDCTSHLQRIASAIHRSLRTIATTFDAAMPTGREYTPLSQPCATSEL